MPRGMAFLQCPVCWTRPMKSGHLYRHMRSIHNCSEEDIEQLRIDVKRRKYEGSAGFPCRVCAKMYYSFTGLCTHMKNTHGFCEQRRQGRVTCPGCPSTFRSHIQLAEHCGQQHNDSGADFTTIKEEFSNIEAFENWKRDMEQKTTTRFIVAGVQKWGEGQKTRYNCHLAGGDGDRVDPLVQRKRFRRTHRVHKHCPCFLRRVVHADGKVSAYGCFGHYGHKLDDLSVLEQSQHDESLEEGAPLVKRSRPGIPYQQRRILKGHKEALALYTGKENLVVYLGERIWKVLSETDDESEGCTVTLNDTQCKCDVENYHCERCGACATQLSCSCKAVDPAGLPCVHAHAVASFSDDATLLIGPIRKKLADDSIPLTATSSSYLDTAPSSSRCSISPPTTPPEFKNVKLPRKVIVVDGSMDSSRPLGMPPRYVAPRPAPTLDNHQDALTVYKDKGRLRYLFHHPGRILIDHQEALAFYKGKENLVMKLGERKWKVLSAVNNHFEGWIVTVHDMPCDCDWESYHCPYCNACAFRISCTCRDSHASTAPCIHAHVVSILSEEAALLIAGSVQRQMDERIPQASSSSSHLDAATLPPLFMKPSNEEEHDQTIRTTWRCRDGHPVERPCNGVHDVATSSHRAAQLDGLVLPKQEDESIPQTSSSGDLDEPPQLSPYSDQSPVVMELPIQATQSYDPVRTRRLYRCIPQTSSATGSAIARLSSLLSKQPVKTGRSDAAVEMSKLKIVYDRCERTYEALGHFLRRLLKSKKATDIVTMNSVLKDTMAVLSKDEAASRHQDGTEFAKTSQLFTTAAVPPSTAVHAASPLDRECKREETKSNDVAESGSQMKRIVLHPSDAEQKFSSMDGVRKREVTSVSEGVAAAALLPENVPVQGTPTRTPTRCDLPVEFIQTRKLEKKTAIPSSEAYRYTDPLDRVCKTSRFSMVSSSCWSCPECGIVILKRNLWSHLKFVHHQDAEELRQSREQINREAGVAHIVCPLCGEHFVTYEDLAHHCQESHSEDGAGGHPQDYEVFSLQFGSKQEYEVWLQERCKATITSFFVSRSRETTGTSRKQKLLCNRGGFFKPQGKNIRRTVSRKDVRHCSCYLDVKLHADDSVSVKGCFGHVGHDVDPALLRLSERQKMLLKGTKALDEYTHPSIQCPICFKGPLDLKKLSEHMLCDHNCSDEDIKRVKDDVRSRKFEGNARIVCRVCGGTYFSSSGFRKHMKTAHSTNAHFRRRITCPGCGRVFGKHLQLAQHCLLQHGDGGVDFSIINKEFSSMEAFESWKSDMERKTNSLLVRGSSWKDARGTLVRKYFCHLTSGDCHQEEQDQVLKWRHRGAELLQKDCPCFIHLFNHADGKLNALACFGHYGHRMITCDISRQHRTFSGHKEAATLYESRKDLIVELGERKWKVLSETGDESEAHTVTMKDTPCSCDVENYHCQYCGACAARFTCSCRNGYPCILPCIHVHAVASFSDQVRKMFGPLQQMIEAESISQSCDSQLDAASVSSPCSSRMSPIENSSSGGEDVKPEGEDVKPEGEDVRPEDGDERFEGEDVGPLPSPNRSVKPPKRRRKQRLQPITLNSLILEGHQKALALYKGKENLVVGLGNRKWKVISETDDDSEGWIVTINDKPCSCETENYHCQRCGACSSQISCSCQSGPPSTIPCIHAHVVATFSRQATQFICMMRRKSANNVTVQTSTSGHLDAATLRSRRCALPMISADSSAEDKSATQINGSCQNRHPVSIPCDHAHTVADFADNDAQLTMPKLERHTNECIPQTSSTTRPMSALLPPLPQIEPPTVANCEDENGRLQHIVDEAYDLTRSYESCGKMYAAFGKFIEALAKDKRRTAITTVENVMRDTMFMLTGVEPSTRNVPAGIASTSHLVKKVATPSSDAVSMANSMDRECKRQRLLTHELTPTGSPAEKMPLQPCSAKHDTSYIDGECKREDTSSEAAIKLLPISVPMQLLATRKRDSLRKIVLRTSGSAHVDGFTDRQCTRGDTPPDAGVGLLPNSVPLQFSATIKRGSLRKIVLRTSSSAHVDCRTDRQCTREATLSEGVAAASLLMGNVPVQLTGTEPLARRMEATSTGDIQMGSPMDRECKREE